MDEEPLDRLQAALADRYRIERTLGSGGMATVYLAHDLKHRRTVAVKALKPELAALVGPQRFLHEIEITAGLNHPHIVPLHDSGEADGVVYFVMPYIEGESLRDRLRREKQLPVEQALAIAREVADALSYAHGRGVVHRDIKPENILLADGHAMVADFGIARALTAAGGPRLTETGMAVGTPAYMSPEQVTGELAVDARADIYALGCVLYEALAGEPPYTGPTAQAILARQLTDAVPRIRHVRDRVPEHVETAITCALAKLPADRHATAREFAAALAGSNVEPAHRMRAAARASSSLPRPARVAIAIAFAAVALVAVAYGLNVGGIRGGAPAPSASADTSRSVAVLPFENVGGDPEQEFFGDGLADELITALSQVRALRVAARTSSFALSTSTHDVREIGRLLNVGTVLVGSVRRSDDRIRVQAQLIDATNGLGLWSEIYDERALTDIFDVQADLALRIAGALEADLSDSERERIVERPTEDIEAYTLYLKGRHAWRQRGEALFTAMEYFEQAIGLDSQYARAHAGLASVFPPLTVFGYIHPREGKERTRTSALRALALDDQLAEAHMVLASYLSVFEWDWEAGEREYQRAIALDPNDADIYVWYAFLLLAQNRYDEAMAVSRRAEALDPLAPLTGVTGVMRLAGQYDSALVLIRDAIELHPTLALHHSGLAEVFLALDRPAEAVASFERAVELAGRSPNPRAGLARALVAAGRHDEARRIVEGLRAGAGTTDIYRPVVAAAIAALGDTDGAIEWLETAYRQHHPDLVTINFEPMYRPLYGDPRFQDLVRRIGLVPRS